MIKKYIYIESKLKITLKSICKCKKLIWLEWWKFEVRINKLINQTIL